MFAVSSHAGNPHILQYSTIFAVSSQTGNQHILQYSTIFVCFFHHIQVIAVDIVFNVTFYALMDSSF